MKELLREHKVRLHESAKTIGFLTTRSFWAEVASKYESRFGDKRLPESRVLRAVRYIFTEDGQVAYQIVKSAHKSPCPAGAPMGASNLAHSSASHQGLVSALAVSEKDSLFEQAPRIEEPTPTAQLLDDQ